MSKYWKLTGKPIYLVGDLHTNYKEFKSMYDNGKYKNCYFIFLGDQTIVREADFNQFKKLDKAFFDDNNIGLFLRGNHDSPFMHNYELYTKYFKSFYPLHTGYIYCNGKKGLILNGAVTVNRSLLVEGVKYWKDYDKVDDWNETEPVDFIIGHTGPLPSAGIFNSDCSRFILEDKVLSSDLAKEQATLKDIGKAVRPKFWCCGHYHTNMHHSITSGNVSYDVHMINKNAIFNFSKYLKKYV